MTTNDTDVVIPFYDYGREYCAKLMVNSIRLLASIYRKKGQLPCQQIILQDKCKSTFIGSYTSKLTLDEEIKKIPRSALKREDEKEKNDAFIFLKYKSDYIDIYNTKINEINNLISSDRDLNNSIYIKELIRLLKEPNKGIRPGYYTSAPWSYLKKIDDILSEALRLVKADIETIERINRVREEKINRVREFTYPGDVGGRKRKTRKTRRRKKTTKRRKIKKTRRTKK